MRLAPSTLRVLSVVALLCVIYSFTLCAQQAPASSPVRIVTDILPEISVNQPYRFQFQAAGGTPPYSWRLDGGELPTGLNLDITGGLMGTPTKIGEFHFVLKVTDSAAPPKSISKEFVVRIFSPLRLEWLMYPRVLSTRIDGSVKVTNGSKDDFDLTVIVVAVNDVGRATAIGYQRLNPKAGVADLSIPFGLDMPQGSYVVHADAIAEVPAKNAIYRQRLQTPSPLIVAVGP
jgi:hypothetical protein